MKKFVTAIIISFVITVSSAGIKAHKAAKEIVVMVFLFPTGY